jgi:hypothetical protein
MLRFCWESTDRERAIVNFRILPLLYRRHQSTTRSRAITQCELFLKPIPELNRCNQSLLLIWKQSSYDRILALMMPTLDTRLAAAATRCCLPTGFRYKPSKLLKRLNWKNSSGRTRSNFTRRTTESRSDDLGRYSHLKSC